MLTPDDELSWQQLAAAYHALYTNETQATLSKPDPISAANQLTRSGTALGHTIPNDLTDIPSLSFRRAQVLGYDGTTIIQLSYVDSNGVPYALCLRPADGAAAQPMTPQGFVGVQGIEWRSGGVEYLFLGKRNQTELQFLAEHFRERV